MASNLSLASATVTDDDGAVLARNEPVLIRANTLRLGTGNDRTHPDVMAVAQIGRGRWEVTLPGARTLTVVRSEDCGCGGRR